MLKFLSGWINKSFVLLAATLLFQQVASAQTTAQTRIESVQVTVEKNLFVLPVGVSTGSPSHAELPDSVHLAGMQLMLVNGELKVVMTARHVMPIGAGTDALVREVRISVPGELLLSGWDVKALQRELERLGVRTKPRPAATPSDVGQAPRSGPVRAGV